MSNIPVTVDRAGLWDAEALSDVAAATADDIEIFIAEALSGERFGEYLTDPRRNVLEPVANGDTVGYALSHYGTAPVPRSPRPSICRPSRVRAGRHQDLHRWQPVVTIS